MPSVKFSLPDASYLTPRDSMLFKSERDANGVYNPNCGICALPTIPEPNGCRLKWNPQPTRVYRVELDFSSDEGVTAWTVVADWAGLPDIINNDIISDTSVLFSVTSVPASNKMSWVPATTEISGPFCYDPPGVGALVIEPPVNFLNFTGDAVTTCSDDNITKRVEIVNTVTRGILPTLPAAATVPYFAITESHESVSVGGRSARRWLARPAVQFEIKETYVVTITNRWVNGLIRAIWSVEVYSELTSRVDLTATIVWVSGVGGSAVYELRYDFDTVTYDPVVLNGPTVTATQGGLLGDSPGNTDIVYKAFPDLYEATLSVESSDSFATHYNTPPVSEPATSLKRSPYGVASSSVDLDDFVTPPTPVAARWRL